MEYYSVWVHDHIISAHTIYDPIAVWGFLSSATNKVKLGSAGLPISLRHAVWSAREISSLDVLSGGRLIVGVVPGRREKECEAAGVLITDLGKRTDEAIRVMKTLWTEPEASFSGRFHNFSKIQMMPQPVQKPHPQIWIGGTTPATFSRVARLGDGWIPAFLSPAQIQAGLQEIQRRTKEKKRDPSKITCSAENFIAIISPGATDLETVSTYFQYRYKSTDDGLKVNIVGKPTEIIKRIEEYIQAGTNHFELRFVARTMDGVAESMKIFSREIAPSFS